MTAEFLEEAPDSLKYYTTHGRIVLGGGGILPDYIVYPDSASEFLRAVNAGGHERDFVRRWLDQHGEAVHASWDGKPEEFVRDFSLSDDVIDEFFDYLDTRGISLQEGAVDAGLKEGALAFSREIADAERDVLSVRLKARMAARLYDRSIQIPVFHQLDRVLIEAMNMWEPAAELASNTGSPSTALRP